MRISDWSSDVCSSDLQRRDPDQHQGHDDPHSRGHDGRSHRARAAGGAGVDMIIPPGPLKVLVAVKPVDFRKGMVGLASLVQQELQRDPFSGIMRSEEHTSELQSLMRISYAVFCLKKKKKSNTNTIRQLDKYANKEH